VPASTTTTARTSRSSATSGRLAWNSTLLWYRHYHRLAAARQRLAKAERRGELALSQPTTALGHDPTDPGQGGAEATERRLDEAEKEPHQSHSSRRRDGWITRADNSGLTNLLRHLRPAFHESGSGCPAATRPFGPRRHVRCSRTRATLLADRGVAVAGDAT
jgi:hypothetical protein